MALMASYLVINERGKQHSLEGRLTMKVRSVKQLLQSSEGLAAKDMSLYSSTVELADDDLVFESISAGGQLRLLPKGGHHVARHPLGDRISLHADTGEIMTIFTSEEMTVERLLEQIKARLGTAWGQVYFERRRLAASATTLLALGLMGAPAWPAPPCLESGRTASGAEEGGGGGGAGGGPGGRGGSPADRTASRSMDILNATPNNNNIPKHSGSSSVVVDSQTPVNQTQSVRWADADLVSALLSKALQGGTVSEGSGAGQAAFTARPQPCAAASASPGGSSSSSSSSKAAPANLKSLRPFDTYLESMPPMLRCGAAEAYPNGPRRLHTIALPYCQGESGRQVLIQCGIGSGAKTCLALLALTSVRGAGAAQALLCCGSAESARLLLQRVRLLGKHTTISAAAAALAAQVQVVVGTWGTLKGFSSRTAHEALDVRFVGFVELDKVRLADGFGDASEHGFMRRVDTFSRAQRVMTSTSVDLGVMSAARRIAPGTRVLLLGGPPLGSFNPPSLTTFCRGSEERLFEVLEELLGINGGSDDPCLEVEPPDQQHQVGLPFQRKLYALQLAEAVMLSRGLYPSAPPRAQGPAAAAAATLAVEVDAAPPTSAAQAEAQELQEAKERTTAFGSPVTKAAADGDGQPPPPAVLAEPAAVAVAEAAAPPPAAVAVVATATTAAAVAPAPDAPLPLPPAAGTAPPPLVAEAPSAAAATAEAAPSPLPLPAPAPAGSAAPSAPMVAPAVAAFSVPQYAMFTPEAAAAMLAAAVVSAHPHAEPAVPPAVHANLLGAGSVGSGGGSSSGSRSLHAQFTGLSELFGATMKRREPDDLLMDVPARPPRRVLTPLERAEKAEQRARRRCRASRDPAWMDPLVEKPVYLSKRTCAYCLKGANATAGSLLGDGTGLLRCGGCRVAGTALEPDTDDEDEDAE